VGFVAVGLAYAMVGVLVLTAAVTYDAKKSTGLDGALQTLAKQPYGPVLLGLIALGVACYGIYCFFDARFRRG
jgi:type IV secretory pathway VirB2 component (pilin)